MNIYQKLHEIQKGITALKKNAKANGYEYLNGDKLLDHVKPLMNELGLLLKQEVLSIENDRLDYKVGIGTQYEKEKMEILSKLMMRFTWIDIETGDKDENLFGANGCNSIDKGVGSALTYAERYFLLKYFHIATDEDDVDNPLRKKEDEPQPKQPVKPAPQQPAKPAPQQPAKPALPDHSKEYEFGSQLEGKYDELFLSIQKQNILTPEQVKACTANVKWTEADYRKAYNWLIAREQAAKEQAAKLANMKRNS